MLNPAWPGGTFTGMTDSTEMDSDDAPELEDEAPVRRSRRSGFAGGLVVGALLGAAIALLLAPEPGSATRRRLRKRLRSVRDGAEEKWEAIGEVARRELDRRRR